MGGPPGPTTVTDPVEPPRSSPIAVAGGVGGAGVLLYVADRLLANDGQLAATMLTRLSPLLGPVWASWPVLFVLVVAGLYGAQQWRAGQRARGAAEAAAKVDAEQLVGKVGDVAEGLAGLRAEVHELRGALQDHADATDTRLRSHDEGLRQVQAEVVGVARRVDVLERPVKPRRRTTT